MNKLLALFVVVCLCSVAVQALSFPPNGAILANDCTSQGSGTIVLNMTSANCISLGEYRLLSCSEYPALNISDPYEIRFSADAPTRSCQVIVTEFGSSNAAVSLNGNAITKADSRLISRGVSCDETVSYYKASVAFDGTPFVLNGTDYGSNLLRIVPTNSALLKSVVIDCSPVSAASITQTLTKTPITERNGTSDVRVVLTKQGSVSAVEYSLLLMGASSDVVQQKPSFCAVSSIGSNTIIFCNSTIVAETNLSFAIRTPSAISYTSTIQYADENGNQQTQQLSGTFSIMSDISANRFTQNQSIEFYTNRGKVPPINITYQDRLYGMYVHCDANATGATVVIRNRNRFESFPCSTNHRLTADTFFIDLLNQNTRQLYGRYCPIPFVMNRSGLYEFELTCEYGNACTGSCYNPLPQVLPTTFAGWTNYFLQGKTFLSFFNDNAIPDCVCDEVEQLQPITLINASVPITVAGLQS